MRVLAVAAHPDDEVLGCGATLAWHAQRGDDVGIAILAEGATSRQERRDRVQAAQALEDLAGAAEAARRILGAGHLWLHDFPDNRMDGVELLDVVKRVEAILDEFRPERVYTHHGGDLNVDHRVVHRAAVTACRPVPGQTVQTLLFFEVPSSTEWQPSGCAPGFAPNWYVDIAATLPRKLAALDAYAAELRAYPHPRSREAVEALARWRGACAGLAAAEAFMLGRHLSS
jgi:N-acetylglucosamine malate deacetylase 1